MTWSPCPPLVYFLSGSSATSTTPSVLPSWMMMTTGFTSLTTMASTTWPVLPSDRSLRDIMMSVRRGQKVKRGKCGRFSLQYLADFGFMRYLKIRQTERSLKDIMISVSLGHTSYKRGRCGSSNMANMFPEISHRLEFYEIFENEVYLSPKIHLEWTYKY